MWNDAEIMGNRLREYGMQPKDVYPLIRSLQPYRHILELGGEPTRLDNIFELYMFCKYAIMEPRSRSKVFQDTILYTVDQIKAGKRISLVDALEENYPDIFAYDEERPANARDAKNLLDRTNSLPPPPRPFQSQDTRPLQRRLTQAPPRPQTDPDRKQTARPAFDQLRPVAQYRAGTPRV